MNTFCAFCRPTHLAAPCWTLSRGKLPAASLVALYTRIILKSIPHPHCPPFCMEKLDQIHYYYLDRPKCWHQSSLIWGLHSMRSKLNMWYSIQKCIICLNERLIRMQSVVFTCYRGKSATRSRKLPALPKTTWPYPMTARHGQWQPFVAIMRFLRLLVHLPPYARKE